MTAIKGLREDGTLPTTALAQVESVAGAKAGAVASELGARIDALPPGGNAGPTETTISTPTYTITTAGDYLASTDTTVQTPDGGTHTLALGGFLVVREVAGTWIVKAGSLVQAVDPQTVTAPAPSFDDTDLAYTIPAVTGVAYLLSGAEKPPATYPVTPPVTVTITAQATSGYTLTGDRTWTHAFAAAPAGSWRTVLLDDFTGPDGTPIEDRATPVGGATWHGGGYNKIVGNRMSVNSYQGGGSNLRFDTGSDTLRVTVAYAIGTTGREGTGLRVLAGAGGLSASTGVGHYSPAVTLSVPDGGGQVAILGVTGGSYDPAPILTPVDGRALDALPRAGTLSVERDGGTATVSIDGEVWATLTPAEGCTFGQVAAIATSDYGDYSHQAAWFFDDVRVEVKS